MEALNGMEGMDGLDGLDGMEGIERGEKDSATLSPQACLALLAMTTIGRMAYSERALPTISLVSYVMAGDSLIIRADEAMAAFADLREAVVAFEADDIDLDLRTGWSVTCIGTVTPVRGEAGEAQSPPVTAAVTTLWDPPTTHRFLRLEPTILRGWHRWPVVAAQLSPEEVRAT